MKTVKERSRLLAIARTNGKNTYTIEARISIKQERIIRDLLSSWKVKTSLTRETHESIKEDIEDSPEGKEDLDQDKTIWEKAFKKGTPEYEQLENYMKENNLSIYQKHESP